MSDIKFKTLTIYGSGLGGDAEHSSTLRFNDGVMTNESKYTNSSNLMFSYKSATTGDLVEAVFNKDNIAGFSFTRA